MAVGEVESRWHVPPAAARERETGRHDQPGARAGVLVHETTMPANNPPMGGTVRVTIPVSVAYDLNKFKKSVASLAGRLGCAACFSGANCTFHIERDYVLDDRLKLSGSVRTVPDTAPAVNLTLGQSVAGNLGALQDAIAKAAGRLGCMACTSGFDLNLRSELKQLKSLNLKLQANGAIG